MEQGKCVSEEQSFWGKMFKWKEAKTPLFINGKGVGKIEAIEEDNVVFSIVRKDEESTGKGKDRNTEVAYFKEVVTFPREHITEVSEGERKLPKSEADKQIDADLEGL